MPTTKRHACAMALLTILAVDFISLFPSTAHAKTEDTYYHVRDDKMEPVSKRAAMLILLNDKDETVIKCAPQMVSDKATLVKKKD